MANILRHYANMRKGRATILVEDFCKAIMANDLNGFMTQFQAFLAGIDYELKLPYEKYYQTIFFVVFRLLGTFIEAESRTNEGRIDAYIRTPTTVYVFEFKLNKTAQTAIDQIVDRRYVEKFMGGGLPIVCVGANFDSEKGRLDSWKQLAVNSQQLAIMAARR